MIRLTIPSIEEDDLHAIREAVTSGFLVQGPRVAAFEEAVASYVGVKHAVAVSNCTAALQLALLMLDTQPGDLVIVTAYSFVATANVIELCGAQPVFVDIQPDTFNLDPNCLELVLNRLMGNADTARRVRAVLPVHTFGQLADMPAICDLAARYGVPVIEDAACALGASLHGRQAGTWGLLGCFSFHPRKAITTGEGGILVTQDAALARRARALRNHGQDPDTLTPDFILPGFNYRLTEFQAALGLTQLSKLERIVAARRSLAAYYDNLLTGLPVQPPVIATGAQHVYQSYVTLLPKNSALRRDAALRQLREQGVEAQIGTYHMPLTTFYRARYGFQAGDFPVTDTVFAHTLALPLHERLNQEDQKIVVDKLGVALST